MSLNYLLKTIAWIHMILLFVHVVRWRCHVDAMHFLPKLHSKMVLLHIKKGEESQFLYQTSVSCSLSEITPKVSQIYNDRKRLERLVVCRLFSGKWITNSIATQDLLLYGAEKPENEKGYTEEQLDEIAQNKGQPSSSNRIPTHKNGFTFYQVTCPTGTRVGLAAGEEAVGVVQPTLDAASKLISKENVRAGYILEESKLKEAFENIKGALTIIYPEGLPSWDSSRLAIEDDEDLEGTAASKEVFKPEEASLWWAGKEMLKEKALCDYVGKNDKTKLIVKIQKRGQGPPVREAPISEEEQKNMMAYYYKKQEELKRLEENEDDDYLHSSWADPKSLKKSFTGVGNNIRY